MPKLLISLLQLQILLTYQPRGKAAVQDLFNSTLNTLAGVRESGGGRGRACNMHCKSVAASLASLHQILIGPSKL